MAYESGEFLINQRLQNYNEFQSGATIFNNQLHVMTSWGLNGRIDLVETIFPLNDLIAQNPENPDEPISDQNLKDSAKWSSTDILEGTQSAKPSLAALPASSPDTLFTFYTSTEEVENISPPMLTLIGGILAIRYPTNDTEDISKNNQWSNPITLLDSDGINMPVPSTISRDICTTVIGDNFVIVSCALAYQSPKGADPRGIIHLQPETANRCGTFLGVYDKTKIDFEKNVWKAEYSSYFGFNSDYQNNDTNRVLIEWFTQVSDNDTLDYNLLLMLSKGSQEIQNYIIPLTISADGAVRFINDTPGDNLFNSQTLPPAPYALATLNRDPTGRLRSWFTVGPNKQLIAYYVEWDNQNTISLIPTTNTITPSEESSYSPSPSAALIYIATEGQYAGTAPATKPGFPDLKTNNYPVYEFVFYGEYPKCQVKRLATVQTVTDSDDNLRTVNLRQSPDVDSAPVFIIGGIFNGPIPLPLENYQDYNPGSGEMNAGSLTYGTSSSVTKGRKVEKSLTIGFDEELKTTKGIGPDYKISFEAGTGSVNEISTEYEIINNFTQEANIRFDNDLKNPVAEPQGIIKKMSVNVQITAYSYLDNYGPSIIATGKNTSKSGMSGGSIQIGYNDTGDFLTFNPYDVTAGDLTSYTAKAINERMVQLGYKGSKYGYADDNYFGDVICQNALPMGDTDYLEMSWDSNGRITTGFTEIQNSYQENSWKYDVNVSAGISGGEGFELFGLGEEVEFSVMADFGLSRDYSTSEDKETQWGIEIGESWGPPSPGENSGPNSVEHYVFRIYFLPVPTTPSILPVNVWTQELFDFLPSGNALTPQIDKNSACWKVVYVVTDIIYKNAPEVTHDTSLDKPSVYRNNV
jgi:hypothetical protein